MLAVTTAPAGNARTGHSVALAKHTVPCPDQSKAGLIPAESFHLGCSQNEDDRRVFVMLVMLFALHFVFARTVRAEQP